MLWKMLKTRRSLSAVNVSVSCVLFAVELFAWVVEKGFNSVQGWRMYHRLVTHLLFKFYFGDVRIHDPSGVLKEKRRSESRTIFASNHPTGLFDRLCMQHVSSQNCYCLTQNWFKYTNTVEGNIHIAARKHIPNDFVGSAFAEVVERLAAGANVWIAVGGDRELHPYIRKVHTGAARIALETAMRDDVCAVDLVPVHLAFEAHCQRGSSVVIEIGQPVQVTSPDEGTVADATRTEAKAGAPPPGEIVDPPRRNKTSDATKFLDSPCAWGIVRRATDQLADRLLPMTNFVPMDKAQQAGATLQKGKKGRLQPGERKAAAEEWARVRAADALVCLAHLCGAHAGGCGGGRGCGCGCNAPGRLRWLERMQRIRRVTQLASRDPEGAGKRISGFQSLFFGEFRAAAERAGVQVFRYRSTIVPKSMRGPQHFVPGICVPERALFLVLLCLIVL